MMATNRSNPRQEIERVEKQREEKARKIESPRASVKGQGKVWCIKAFNNCPGMLPGSRKT